VQEGVQVEATCRKVHQLVPSTHQLGQPIQTAVHPVKAVVTVDAFVAVRSVIRSVTVLRVVEGIRVGIKVMGDIRAKEGADIHHLVVVSIGVMQEVKGLQEIRELTVTTVPRRALRRQLRHLSWRSCSTPSTFGHQTARTSTR
jgi:hypothetical protein